MKEELSILVQAQYPLIYLVTSEEERAEQVIAKVAQLKTQHHRVFVWTVTHGFTEYGQPQEKPQHNTVSPQAAIDGWYVIGNQESLFSKISILLLLLLK